MDAFFRNMRMDGMSMPFKMDIILLDKQWFGPQIKRYPKNEKVGNPANVALNL